MKKEWKFLFFTSFHCSTYKMQEILGYFCYECIKQEASVYLFKSERVSMHRKCLVRSASDECKHFDYLKFSELECSKSVEGNNFINILKLTISRVQF